MGCNHKKKRIIFKLSVLPHVKQITRFARTYRDSVRRNTIISIKKTVKAHLYHDGITDKEEWLFFGVVLDIFFLFFLSFLLID